MLMSNSAYSQVTANFSTNSPTSACGLAVVEFQDLSTGNPNSWLWDLGNGKISNSKYTILLNTKLPYIYYEVNLMR
ncbi:MAG: hypothetical protein QGG97_01530 [Flavobacteriales bacterium]|jgi:PKD repeat protein|nr:hypothetical protein [Flavobacteriales bacterium]|tara:strand:- start:12384 stop:12611 length:228 start_codon:yes stop_codon:yes gene_type:complete